MYEQANPFFSETSFIVKVFMKLFHFDYYVVNDSINGYIDV